MKERTETFRLPNSDRAEMNDVIDHLNAVLDRDEQTALAAGEARIAWLTYRDDDGRMRYTSVAAESGDGAWVAAGEEMPEHSSALIVYDPARTIREVEALRQVINDYRMADRACMGADGPHDPEYATIRAGRDAFKSVLMAYAKVIGWED
jgi:hypothetical protein